jgi:hypothetical protein
MKPSFASLPSVAFHSVFPTRRESPTKECVTICRCQIFLAFCNELTKAPSLLKVIETFKNPR